MSAANLIEATHAFCDLCDGIQPATFEYLETESTDGKYVGGDVVCQSCLTPISTLYKEAGE